MNRSGVSTAFRRSPGQIEQLGAAGLGGGVLLAGLLTDDRNDGFW